MATSSPVMTADTTGTVNDPDATVEVFVDGTSVGTAEVDAAGNWTLDLTETPFAAAFHCDGYGD